MTSFVRSAMAVIGVLLMLAGLVLIVALPFGPIPGLQLVAMGAFLVVVLAIERGRYRSAAAEKTNAEPGPGGGEPAGPLEARFRATSEVFVDPTTGQRMRVAVDPATGERRYIAEG